MGFLVLNVISLAVIDERNCSRSTQPSPRVSPNHVNVWMDVVCFRTLINTITHRRSLSFAFCRLPYIFTVRQTIDDTSTSLAAVNDDDVVAICHFGCIITVDSGYR